MPELQVLSGSLQWKTIPIAGARFLIGRKDSCHLILKDGWVSREHTLIMEPKPGEFRVQDLDSENGTFLNGERIRDSAMRHGDVLRVGRTEMRFIQHAGTAAQRSPSPVSVTIPTPRWEADAGLRTEALDRSDPEDTAGQTLRLGGRCCRPPPTGVPRATAPRIDLRERVRRLEEMLLEGEQANAALAAENAVLKRALARLGLLDKKTGAVDPSKLTPPPARLVPEAMLRFVMNPLARITFPGKGPEVAERPRARGWNLEPRALPARLRGDRLPRDPVRGGDLAPRLSRRRRGDGRARQHAGRRDRPLLAHLPRPAARSGATGDLGERVPPGDAADRGRLPRGLRGLRPRAALRRGFGPALRRRPHAPRPTSRAAPAPSPAPSSSSTRRRITSMRVLGQTPPSPRRRSLAESGRLAPFIVLDQSRAAAFAQGAESRDPARSDARLDRGRARCPHAAAAAAADRRRARSRRGLRPAVRARVGTLGLAATRGASRADLAAAAADALGAGLMAQAMPPSRARAAFVCTIIGDGIELEPNALEAVHTTVARMLPQAQRVEGVWQDSGEFDQGHRVRGRPAVPGDVLHAWTPLIAQEEPCSAWRSARLSALRSRA